MKRFFVLALFGILAALVVIAPTANAHRSGCHRWHSCPSDSGSYVCGDTGYSTYCGGSTYQAPTPVITTKDEVSDTPIRYQTTTVDNPDEYIGYKELVTQGKNGSKRTTTTITYSDGVESWRGTPAESTTAEPVAEVFSVGTREIPTSFVDYILEGKTSSFLWFKTTLYDIHIYGKPNTDYALIKNGRVIELGSTDSHGDTYFRDIKLKSGDTLELGTHTGSRFLWFMPPATTTSEKTSVDIENQTLLTEYDRIHGKTETLASDLSDVNACSAETEEDYFKSRSDIDKTLDEIWSEFTIYYPEICTIKIEEN